MTQKEKVDTTTDWNEMVIKFLYKKSSELNLINVQQTELIQLPAETPSCYITCSVVSLIFCYHLF